MKGYLVSKEVQDAQRGVTVLRRLPIRVFTTREKMEAWFIGIYDSLIWETIEIDDGVFNAEDKKVGYN